MRRLLIPGALLFVAACSPHEPAGTDRHPLFYRSPMDPAVTSPVPAKDAMGMDYVAVYPDGARGETQISLSPAVVQKLGVRTATAMLEALPRQIVATGRVSYDERTVRDIHVPVDGWIRHLSAGYPGAAISKGQTLFEQHSPQLAVIDAQYLRAMQGEARSDENPFQRGLRTYGLSDAQIDSLRRGQRPAGTLRFQSPAAGVVTELLAREGSFVMAGARVMQVASLDPAWIIVAVPQAASASIAARAPVRLTALADSSETYTGKVDYVYPELDSASGTLQMRVAAPNAEGSLRAGMLVSATISAPAAAPVVTVPREAVIRTGRADRVVRVLSASLFAPTNVRVGWESGGKLAILQGLQPGEQVVTSGIFLIDSEANLQHGLGRMSAAPQPAAAPFQTDRRP